MRKAWVPLAVQGTALALLMVLQHVPESSGAFPDLGDFKRGFKANTQRCSNAHHVQLLQVMALMEAPIRTGYDRNSKCFICCLMDTYEMVTPDGEFMDGKIRRFAADLPESNFKEVINKNLDTCLREGGSERRQKTKEASAIDTIDRLMSKRKRKVPFSHSASLALVDTNTHHMRVSKLIPELINLNV